MHPSIQNLARQHDDDPDTAVIATDGDGRIVFWNRGAEILYGWSGDEVAGKDVVEITPGDLSREEAVEIMRSMRQGEPWQGHFLVRSKDGAHFMVEVTNRPVKDESGELIGVVGLSRRAAYLEQ